MVEKQKARYKSIVDGFEEVFVLYFDVKEDAEKYAKKLRKWTKKVVTRGRNEKGHYIKRWALVCCK